jgi:hypothetical protein
MSDVNVNPEEAAAKARQIIEADVNTRVEAVRSLADAANRFDTAEQQLKEATAAHERAWSAAISAGWSEKDLRATGVRAPGASAPRPRKRRTTSAVQSAPAE